jgi:hypothetical protein
LRSSPHGRESKARTPRTEAQFTKSNSTQTLSSKGGFTMAGLDNLENEDLPLQLTVMA